MEDGRTQLLHGLIQVEVEAAVEQDYHKCQRGKVRGYLGKGAFELKVLQQPEVRIRTQYGAQEKADKYEDKNVRDLGAFKKESAHEPYQDYCSNACK